MNSWKLCDRLPVPTIWKLRNLILLPANGLPYQAADRHAVLRDYFCDKDATATLTRDGWELTLAWSDDFNRYVDPDLPFGLNWWDKDITPANMVHGTRGSGPLLISLYDTWTLYSWSEWLAEQSNSDTPSVVILHVDDHKDVGSPRLFVEGAGLRDPLTGRNVELDNPDCIRCAILSGAVGMGSFMTPFLRAVPNAQVRHLRQPPKTTKTQNYQILSHEENDCLLDRDARRPITRLREKANAVGPATYRITPDVEEWLSDTGSGPILLHIDMDYFNNRYDGDSAWISRSDKLNPTLLQILSKIDELTSALADAEIASRIERIAVAFSPGFFPAEYWRAAADRLLPALERLNDD